MTEAPGWREPTRNIFQTSVCSLTGSKVSSNGNSKIEYIEDFAASNDEAASAIQISCKNHKLTNKDDAQTDEEVLDTGDKHAHHDTPDLKATHQKSSI